jgi:hypothetical protein
MGIEMLVNAKPDQLTDPLTISIMSLSVLGSVMDTFDKLSGSSTVSDAVGGLVAEMSRMFTLPMVGIISINADKYEQIGRNETPESLVIAEMPVEGSPKKYVTDNTAPRPRQWRIHGFIDSIIPGLENGMIIKPSLQIQKQYLENTRKSRAPFSFKTTDNEYVDCLIENITYTETPRNQNKIEVDIAVKEFVKLEAKFTTGVGGLIPAGADGGSVLMQLPLQSTLNSVLLVAELVSAAVEFVEKTVAAIIKEDRPVHKTIYNLVALISTYGIEQAMFEGKAAQEEEDRKRIIPVESVSCSPNGSINMKTNSRIKLRYSVVPYSATNRSVNIKAQNGLVTVKDTNGVAEITTGGVKGNCQVSVESVSDPSKNAMLSITIGDTETGGIKAEAIVPPTSIVLGVGSTVKLNVWRWLFVNVIVNPKDAYDKSWTVSSSNDYVQAFNDNGVLLIHTTGTVGRSAYITVTSSANSFASAGFTVQIAADGANGDWYGADKPATGGPAVGGAAKEGVSGTEVRMPLAADQQIAGSRMFVSAITGADTFGNFAFAIDCDPDIYHIKMVWNHHAERKYNEITEFIKETARSINVYDGLEVDESGKARFKTNHHRLDSNIDGTPNGNAVGAMDVLVRDYRAMHEAIETVVSQCINVILGFTSSEDDAKAADVMLYTIDSEGRPSVLYSQYIEAINAVITRMEAAQWPYGMKIKTFKMLEDTLALKEMLLNEEGIHLKAYNNPDILPSYAEFSYYINKNFLFYSDTFEELGYWHSLMFYTATINSGLHPSPRTFNVNPNGVYFTGNEDYIVSIIGGIADEETGYITREGINSAVICIEVAT